MYRFCTFEADSVHLRPICTFEAVSVHLRLIHTFEADLRENWPQMYRSASNVRTLRPILAKLIDR